MPRGIPNKKPAGESAKPVVGTSKKKRRPLGVSRLKLEVHNQDPNYVYRHVSDRDNRINDAIEGGYEMAPQMEMGHDGRANTDPGGRTSQVVDSIDGKPITGHLMRIKREWYEEDQADKEKALAEKDKTIAGGDIDGKMSDHRYIPT